MRWVLIAAALLAATASARSMEPWQDEGLKVIREHTGDRFADMSWQGNASLWLFRRDIGADQTELARHVCALLEVAGMPEARHPTVSIFDVSATMKAEAELKPLGKATC